MTAKVFATERPISGNVVLGIDPSLTGFAVTVLPISPTIPDYSTWVYKSPKRGVERLSDITLWLSDTLRPFDVLSVAMESGVVQSHSALVLGELAGILKLYCYDYFQEDNARFPLQVPPMSLKKFIAGKGNGVAKNQILLKVYQSWGVEFTDDNAADSFGLAHIARLDYLKQPPEYVYRADVMKKLSDPKFRDTQYL